MMMSKFCVVRKFIIISILLCCITLDARPLRMFTIMLDPAGDARETGRVIEDSLERAVTFACAQKLKEAIESYLPNSTVIITRKPGEVMQPLQKANFANRLPIDLYLSINCVQTSDAKPILYLYQFSLGDSFIAKPNSLSMTPFHKAHHTHAPDTAQYGKKIAATLAGKEHLRLFKTEGPYPIPFAPLIGIQAPALGIELSIASQDAALACIPSIAFSIATALEE